MAHRKPPGITIAYCYASGHIEFGPRLPQGALPIARGPDQLIRDTITAQCRHGYPEKDKAGNKVADGPLLVPGLPEADDDNAGLEALREFAKRLRPALTGKINAKVIA